MCSPFSPKTTRLLKLYEDDLHVRYGERTIPQYLACVRLCLAWLSRRGVELTEARIDDLVSFQSDLLERRKADGSPYAVETQCGVLTAAKSFFRFLYRRGYLLHDPAASLDLPRSGKRLPRTVLSPEEAARILEAAKEKTPTGLRDRAILEAFYATGIRVTELSHLTPYDVDTEERTLRVVMGKGKKDRNLPLTRRAAEAIEAYLAQGRSRFLKGPCARYLFLGDAGGFMHRAVLSRLVHHYARRAGVDKRVTPHVFRHSVATHLLRGKADIRHIQVLLGHARLASTERYTRVEITDLREVIERAHPRGR